MNKKRLTKRVDGISTVLKEVASKILNIKEEQREEKRNTETDRAETKHD